MERGIKEKGKEEKKRSECLPSSEEDGSCSLLS
jgi:hypothetical protein